MSMLWQRFTERAKRTVIAAQEEAAQAGELYVSPEHLLLGLVKENDSVSTKVLERLGVAASRVQQEIDQQIGGRDRGRLSNNDVTLDPRMKRVLDFAYDEARQAKTNYIGTEHLLLGIIREGDGIAFQTLAKLGVDIVSARKEVESYLGGERGTSRRYERKYQVGRFTDPADAEEWLNERLLKGYQLIEQAGTPAGLWLIMLGQESVDAPAGPTGETTAGESQVSQKPETDKDGE